jgi:hypothetical protein
MHGPSGCFGKSTEFLTQAPRRLFIQHAEGRRPADQQHNVWPAGTTEKVRPLGCGMV